MFCYLNIHTRFHGLILVLHLLFSNLVLHLYINTFILKFPGSFLNMYLCERMNVHVIVVLRLNWWTVFYWKFLENDFSIKLDIVLPYFRLDLFKSMV